MSFNAGATHLLRLRPLTEVDEHGYICAAKKLVKEGFLLEEDEDRIVERAARDGVNLFTLRGRLTVIRQGVTLYCGSLMRI